MVSSDIYALHFDSENYQCSLIRLCYFRVGKTCWPPPLPHSYATRETQEGKRSEKKENENGQWHPKTRTKNAYKYVHRSYFECIIPIEGFTS